MSVAQAWLPGEITPMRSQINLEWEQRFRAGNDEFLRKLDLARPKLRV